MFFKLTDYAVAITLLQVPLARASIETWCGKVYDAGSPEITPLGWLREPTASSQPLLDVQITSRFNIYVAGERRAEFIVDAGLSPYHGAHYKATPNPNNTTSDILNLVIEIGRNISLPGSITVGSTNNLFSFDPSMLTPRPSPYTISLTAMTNHSNDTYTASTELFYLPTKSGGSIVKVDNLYGALHYKNKWTNGTFKPIFPFGFYADYSGYLNVSTDNANTYKAQGFNAILPEASFTDSNMTQTLDELDELGLMFQYSMRSSFTNLPSVKQQVSQVKDHPSLLTWYTADEPDGWKYALNSTTLAYNLLAKMDKYHPTALVLNCQNHWFQQYTQGADIILEDAYPVGISANYSLRWDTPCNATYGDCGCDNCAGALTDVSDRLDDFYTYGAWIGGSGRAARKPVWAVAQAMSGQSYWSRAPTGAEAWVMDLLALNHGAKGRLAWIYPPSDELIQAASALARVVTTSPVVDFLVGANPSLVSNGKRAAVDVSYWSLPRAGKMMVGIVNPRNASVEGPVAIELPVSGGVVPVSALESQPWGNVGWTLDGGTTMRLIASEGLAALETSLVILS